MAEAVLTTPAIKPKVSRDDWTMRAFIGVIGLYLVVTLALPLYTMMSKSFRDHDGGFVGLANYVDYFATPALTWSIWNSLQVATITTFITVSIGFTFAYALTRSCIPLKGLFQSITMIPILVPSLLPGIALVYLFGTQGLIKELLFGHSIYGPIGIVIAEVFFTLPHAIIILITSLSIADSRLYEAAVALRASRLRIFLTVTLPGCRYGLISAAFVVFTLAITDFGAPKVIGGDFNVLATDVYKQVIGQQNFEMGARRSRGADERGTSNRPCSSAAGTLGLIRRAGPAHPQRHQTDTRDIRQSHRQPGGRYSGCLPALRRQNRIPALDGLQRLQNRVAGLVESVAPHPLDLADPHRDAGKLRRADVDLDLPDVGWADHRECPLKSHRLGLQLHPVLKVLERMERQIEEVARAAATLAQRLRQHRERRRRALSERLPALSGPRTLGIGHRPLDPVADGGVGEIIEPELVGQAHAVGPVSELAQRAEPSGCGCGTAPCPRR